MEQSLSGPSAFEYFQPGKDMGVGGTELQRKENVRIYGDFGGIHFGLPHSLSVLLENGRFLPRWDSE